MKLKEYFEKNHIDPVAFAVQAGISVTSIYRYMRGTKPTVRLATKIEQLTEGKVTLKDLRGENAT